MRRTVLVLMTVTALLCCFTANARIQPGDTPPDTLGSTLRGQDVTTSSLHGKVVVISFWATWCTYCMKELPVLATIQAHATQRGMPLQVVAVNYREDRRTFFRTSKILHKNQPGLLVTWDRNGAIGKPYGVSSLPMMVMLHRDGTVAHVHVGYGADMLDRLVDEINALLLEPPAATTPVAQR